MVKEKPINRKENKKKSQKCLEIHPKENNWISIPSCTDKILLPSIMYNKPL